MARLCLGECACCVQRPLLNFRGGCGVCPEQLGGLLVAASACAARLALAPSVQAAARRHQARLTGQVAGPSRVWGRATIGRPRSGLAAKVGRVAAAAHRGAISSSVGDTPPPGSARGGARRSHSRIRAAENGPVRLVLGRRARVNSRSGRGQLRGDSRAERRGNVAIGWSSRSKALEARSRRSRARADLVRANGATRGRWPKSVPTRRQRSNDGQLGQLELAKLHPRPPPTTTGRRRSGRRCRCRTNRSKPVQGLFYRACVTAGASREGARPGRRVGAGRAVCAWARQMLACSPFGVPACRGPRRPGARDMPLPLTTTLHLRFTRTDQLFGHSPAGVPHSAS